MTAQGLQRISATGCSLLKGVATVSAIWLMLCVFAVGDAQAQRNPASAALSRAIDLYNGNKFAEALPLAVQALELSRQAGDANGYVSALSLAGKIYSSLGRYSQSEEALTTCMAVAEKTRGPRSEEFSDCQSDLALVYQKQGRFSQAEQLYKKDLAEAERRLGRDHPEIALTLNNLGSLYVEQGRAEEARQVFTRSLAIYEKARGADHAELVMPLSNLALLNRNAGRLAQAEQEFKRVLAICEKSLGPQHPHTASVLNNLAVVYFTQQRFADAEPLYKRSLEIRQKLFGPAHEIVAQSLSNLAVVYQKLGRFAEAEKLLREGLATWEKALGPEHPSVALAFMNLGLVAFDEKKFSAAHDYNQRAVAIYAARTIADARDDRQDRQATRGARDAFYELAHTAFELGAAEPRQRARLASEAFEAMQWAQRRQTGMALEQMAARFAASDDQLAARVRERQDLVRRWQQLDRRLSSVMSAPDGSAGQKDAAQVRSALAAATEQLKQLTAGIERDFSDYTQLISPKPLSMSEAQKLLGADEALVAYLRTYSHVYVWALTRDGFDWQRIPLEAKLLDQKVVAFRKGLDLDELTESLAGGPPAFFDVGQAHELYAALLGPVEALIKDKQHLIVVPTGPMTGIPFHLLVVKKPSAAGVTSLEDFTRYREAEWLIRRQAVSALPSVSSLKSLRLVAKASTATKPLIGYGDPIFSASSKSNNPRATKAARRSQTRAYSTFWEGRSVNLKALAEALVPLPETADELRVVAKAVGAAESDLYLGAAATETAVKRADLLPYRIVYFATHGLIAGNVEGLGEPALALTLPSQVSDVDDGLLTAGEVAQLKLNADWVVLSACNTASGTGPGAEAFTGLARAFFYAGARSLLVSHWAVDSKAAERLTTDTFRLLAKNPAMSRAQAQREAMLAYLDDASSKLNPYPAFWAPFSIVGEGGASRTR